MSMRFTSNTMHLRHWSDETGLSNQANYGRSFAPERQTPAIPQPAKRSGQSMISSVTKQGKLHFMTYDAALKAVTFIMFLRRVLKDAGRRLFVIVDDQRAHRANTRIPAPKTHLAAVNRHRGCAAMLLSAESSSSWPIWEEGGATFLLG